MIVGDYLRAIVSLAAPNLNDGAKMVWDWELTASELPITLSLDGADIVQAIIDRYYVPVQNALSTTLIITQVELRSYTHPGDGYLAAGTLWAGTNAGNLMPPANAMSIQMLRSDFTMHNGRKAYPGGVSSSVDGIGGVTGGTKAVFATATDAWGSTSMEVEFMETGATFDEVVIRAPKSYELPVIKAQRVSEYTDVYWGTQNSRK